MTAEFSPFLEPRQARFFFLKKQGNSLGSFRLSEIQFFDEWLKTHQIKLIMQKEKALARGNHISGRKIGKGNKTLGIFNNQMTVITSLK